MKRFVAYLGFFLIIANLSAQEADDILDYVTFMELVKTNHPLAMKAELQTELGRMEVRANRGAFDPKVYADVSQKYFDELQYYSHQEGGVIIPTWLGIELEGGYQNNDGRYLNPEAFVPEDGLWWAGLSVPLGRDLFIDSRRAALRQAQLFRQASEAERTLMLNKVLLEAGKAYWKWFAAYHMALVYDESVTVVETRFSNTVAGALVGEQANIDTVEAKIQMQNRRAQYQEAKVEYQNARVLLSTYLWDKGMVPLVLRDEVHPPDRKDILATPAEQLYRDSALIQHPLLRFNRLQIDQLEIERRLKAEQIKPKIDLKYRALQNAFEYDREGAGILEDNYSWGLSFTFPLFIRKERGELQRMKIKLQQSEFEFSNQQQQIKIEIQQAINRWDATAQQAKLYESASKDYLRLLEAEQQLFEIGESSVFMVNNRELGYIKTQLNWIKSLSDNQITRLETYFKLGTLATQ